MPTQLAVRLDEELIDGLDWLVVRCHYANRTDAIREAIRTVLAEQRRREIDDEYVEAYARLPQTEEESAHLKYQSFANLDDDPGSLEDWV